MNMFYRSLSITFVFFLFLSSVHAQESIFEKGKKLYDRKNYKEAVKVFNKGTRSKETNRNPELWYYLGLSYLNLKNTKKGASALRRATKYDKKNALIWNRLGLVEIELDELKDAKKSFKKAVKFAPTSPTYKTNLAYLYLLGNKYGRVRKLSKQVLELDPKNINAHYFRGVSYLWEGKFEKAISDAEKSIDLDETYTNGYVLKSDSLLFKYGRETQKTGDLKRPVFLLREALETLNSCLLKCESKNRKGVENRLHGLEAFYNFFNRETIDQSTPANQTPIPIKILTKPKPGYTDRARQSNTQGAIRIAVLFGASGRIERTMVLKGLPNGLTQKAVAAAKKITFEPVTENGKPISVVKVVQYSFSIY